MLNVDSKTNKSILILAIIAVVVTIISMISYVINLHIKTNIKIEIDYSYSNISIDLDSKTKGKLVPVGRVTNTSEVDKHIYEYIVIIADDELEAHQELVVSVKYLEITNSESSHLVLINIDGTGMTHTYMLTDNRIVVRVEIMLEEPIDEEEYFAIVNEEIKIILNFKIN